MLSLSPTGTTSRVQTAEQSITATNASWRWWVKGNGGERQSICRTCSDGCIANKRRQQRVQPREMQLRASLRSLPARSIFAFIWYCTPLIFALIWKSCRLSSLGFTHSVLSAQRSALSHREVPRSRTATYAYQILFQNSDVVSGAR